MPDRATSRGRPLGSSRRDCRRAQQNLFETLPLFAAAVLIAHVAGREGALTLWGAWLYAVGRLIYLPIYAAGIPYLRSLVWVVSLVGLILVLAAILGPPDPHSGHGLKICTGPGTFLVAHSLEPVSVKTPGELRLTMNSLMRGPPPADWQTLNFGAPPARDIVDRSPHGTDCSRRSRRRTGCRRSPFATPCGRRVCPGSRVSRPDPKRVIALFQPVADEAVAVEPQERVADVLQRLVPSERVVRQPIDHFLGRSAGALVSADELVGIVGQGGEDRSDPFRRTFAGKHVDVGLASASSAPGRWRSPSWTRLSLITSASGTAAAARCGRHFCSS